VRFLHIDNDKPLKLSAVKRKKKAFASLCRRKGIKLLFLHGSLARDRHGRLSDVDFAVFGKELSLDDYLKINQGLSQIVGREDIDLADLSKASSLLAMQVITKGIPLYVANPKILARFRYDSFRRYLDSKYLRERFAHYVTQAVQ